MVNEQTVAYKVENNEKDQNRSASISAQLAISTSSNKELATYTLHVTAAYTDATSPIDMKIEIAEFEWSPAVNPEERQAITDAFVKCLSPKLFEKQK